jgi:YD repeat-containing protein
MGSVLVNNALDATNRFAYNAANQQVFSSDASGDITQYEYDAVGNLRRKTAYATPVSLTGTPSAKTIQQSVIRSAQDHVSRTVYDAAGNAVADVDALGHVTERRFDATGNVIAVIRRDKTIDPAALDAHPDAPGLRALITASGNDRIERSVFDAAGHVRYTVDALGYVKQSDIDSFGRITKTTGYDAPVTLTGETATASSITKALRASAGQDRVNTFIYDIQGNLLASTDPIGGQESYTYDAAGRKLSFTNKNGATWEYSYDAAGHMTLERAPAVTVSSLTDLSTVQGKTTYNLQTGQVRPETRIAYDAFGNVSSRTEAANTSNACTTLYQYDAAGRQIKTIFPPVAVYNPGADPLTAAGLAVRADSAPVALSTTVAYDAFGNAVMNEDFAGNRSYKAYDRLGRVRQRHQPDALCVAIQSCRRYRR